MSFWVEFSLAVGQALQSTQYIPQALMILGVISTVIYASRYVEFIVFHDKTRFFFQNQLAWIKMGKGPKHSLNRVRNNPIFKVKLYRKIGK